LDGRRSPNIQESKAVSSHRTPNCLEQRSVAVYVPVCYPLLFADSR
jgi:hypothetical protein